VLGTTPAAAPLMSPLEASNDKKAKTENRSRKLLKHRRSRPRPCHNLSTPAACGFEIATGCRWRYRHGAHPLDASQDVLRRKFNAR